MKGKISIVTATFNAEKYLENMIQSVLTQTFKNFELIIIDGESLDETKKILEKYNTKITYWVSEADNGIYDAWNKGLKMATGDWIMFLGSDDVLVPDALQQYNKFLMTLDKTTEYVSSRVNMVDSSMNLIRVKGWSWEWPRFLREMTVAHPGSLHARSFFTKYGLFDTSYKIVGDYELLLRPGSTLKAAFLNSVTVIMDEGGVSNSSAAIKEHYRAVISTGEVLPVLAAANFILVTFKFHFKALCRSLGINIYYRK